MKTRNPLTEAFFFFGLFSILLILWTVTIHNGLLPFSLKNPPRLGGQKIIFQLAIVVGLVLPTIWLLIDWSKRQIRMALLAFLLMQGLQIATESTIARYISPTLMIPMLALIIPTAVLYVGYRIVQIIRLQMLVFHTNYRYMLFKLFRICIVLANLALWGFLFIRLIVWRLPALF